MLYQLSHSRVSEGKINVFIRKFQESIKLFFPSICELPPCPFSISSRTVFSRPSALPLHTPPFFLSTKEGTIAPQNENTEGFLTVAAAFPANISHDTQRKEDKRGEEATFYLILRTLGGVHGKAEKTLQHIEKRGYATPDGREVRCGEASFSPGTGDIEDRRAEERGGGIIFQRRVRCKREGGRCSRRGSGGRRRCGKACGQRRSGRSPKGSRRRRRPGGRRRGEAARR